MWSRRAAKLCLGLCCLAALPSFLWAAPPSPDPAGSDIQALAAKIDEHIAAKWTASHVKPAEPASDAEFLRRVYLDLAGRIPRVAEVRDFLDDTAPDKRQRVVEQLLDGPQYIGNFTAVWRAVLLPQNNNQQLQIFSQQLENWLLKRMRENTPYDQLVRELLTASLNNGPPRAGIGGGGAGASLGLPDAGAFAFYQANELKPENLAASTSRVFLGVKLECAQCHDHPFAPWKRKQFWEYAAFFSGIAGQGNNPRAVGAEVPNRRQIDIPGTDKTVQARFLSGDEPTWRDGVSTRATLAEWMTSPENPYFARATVNRVWAHLFGVGIVDPVEEPGDDNPPSHPELLDLLAREFADHKFDLKFLIEAITASRAYQLGSALTDQAQLDPRLFARMSLKGLTGEQFFDSIALATGFVDQAPAQLRNVVVLGRGTPTRQEFLAKFGNSSMRRTEFTTSILQALALMNGNFVADATSADLQRSVTLSGLIDAPFMNNSQRVETLFLATLSRPPRADEAQRFVKYVNDGGAAGDQKKALGDVFWALLNSSEFILNH
jgi:hypothetical protein